MPITAVISRDWRVIRARRGRAPMSSVTAAL
jgi:hypothetical protein